MPAQTPEKTQSAFHIPVKAPDKNTIHVPHSSQDIIQNHNPQSTFQPRPQKKNTIHNPHSSPDRQEKPQTPNHNPSSSPIAEDTKTMRMPVGKLEIGTL
jgi:hypothetical protein